MRNSIKILGSGYGGYLVAKFAFYYDSFLWLTILLGCTWIMLIAALVNFLWSLYKKKELKKSFLNIALLLFPFPVILISIHFPSSSKKDIEIFASMDGVIAGSDYTFYTNNKTMYCQSSLLGEKCYFGTSTFVNDTFKIEYSNIYPKRKYETLIIEGKSLYVLNDDNQIEFRYRIVDFSED